MQKIFTSKIRYVTSDWLYQKITDETNLERMQARWQK